jgi:hypothetical protein
MTDPTKLFEATSTHLGLPAPTFIWWLALSLVVSTAGVLISLLWKVRRAVKPLRSTSNGLKRLRQRFPSSGKQGLDGQALEEASKLIGRVAWLQNCWNRFKATLIMKEISGKDQVWASDSAGTCFDDEAVLSAQVNRVFYSAWPGIATGFGLLGTFLAILIALKDVHFANNQVTGLERLIEGLSGKFVSSVAALTSATLFTIVERNVQHRLTDRRLSLVASIDGLIPRLSPARILSDIQGDIAQQSDIFRSFNTDLSLKLRQSMSESMGPTLGRMVESIEELNQLLSMAETEKNQSLNSSLQTLLQSVQSALTSSLTEMSRHFKESLSGSATGEIQKVTDSMGQTARLLENMNVQFQSTQNALGGLINQAKSANLDQMALGKQQIEELTNVLRSMMVQINETAGASVNKMAETLTGVVHDLSAKVNELSTQMSTAFIEQSQKATTVVDSVVAKADAWSSQSAEKLAKLIESHQTQLQNVQEVERVLMATLGLFNNSMQQYAHLNGALERISKEANAMVTAVAGATQEMQKTQTSSQQVANLTSAQVNNLANANKAQDEAWKRIQGSMERYESLFGNVEKRAAALLSTISEQYKTHLELSSSAYQNLVRVANEHFANGTKQLGASVSELNETLQELSENLEIVRREKTGDGDRS